MTYRGDVDIEDFDVTLDGLFDILSCLLFVSHIGVVVGLSGLGGCSSGVSETTFT